MINTPFMAGAPQVLQQQYTNDPRMQMLKQMGANASSTAPAYSTWQILARALQGGMAGFAQNAVNEQYTEQAKGYQDTLAEALKYGTGQGDTFDKTTGTWSAPTGESNPELMANILSQNPLTAPMAMEQKFKEMGDERTLNRALKLQEAKDAGAAPRSREVKRNGKLITEEWDKSTKSWKEIGSAPQFKPGSESESALEKKIEMMVRQGIPLGTATKIATGVYTVSRDVVTGVAEVIDKSTGKRVGDMPASQPEARPEGVPEAAQPGAPQPESAPKPKTLWGLTDLTAGIGPTAGELGEKTLGQIPGVSVAPQMTEARQFMRAAQNDLIRALSINPKFPVSEINRLRSEIDIEPKLLDSPEALRGRMKAINQYLKQKIVNEEDAAANASLPADTRKASAQAANDIKNFLNILGVPDDGGGLDSETKALIEKYKKK